MRWRLLDKSQTSLLPKSEGVYIFYGPKKSVLYIGKANNLRQRVRNHFQKSVPAHKDIFFAERTEKIGYVPLQSEVESLILESQLIKRYQPKFNVLFRDDKKYFYVGITKEEWPMIFLTHQIENKKGKIKSEFIGPFTDGIALNQTLRILRKFSPYRTCNFFPKSPCLWYHLNRCPAPCLSKREAGVRKSLKKETILRKKKYQDNIRKVKMILKGKRSRLLSDMKREMKKLAKAQEFEKAIDIREKMKSLEKIFSHKNILFEIQIVKEGHQGDVNLGVLFKNVLGLPKVPQRIEGYDISNIQEKEMVGSMVVFKLSRNEQIGRLNLYSWSYEPDKSQYRRFGIKTIKEQNDVACLAEIIKRRLSHEEWQLPDLIYVDGGIAQFNVAVKTIKRFSRVTIPVISLAKRKNLLYNITFNKPTSLDKLPKEFKMTLLRLRDESHRFAIVYHKVLRRKNLLHRLQ
ncbi:MAG: GIY-YIG nuclease family protein [Patescibacteria group bacterium]